MIGHGQLHKYCRVHSDGINRWCSNAITGTTLDDVRAALAVHKDKLLFVNGMLAEDTVVFPIRLSPEIILMVRMPCGKLMTINVMEHSKILKVAMKFGLRPTIEALQCYTVRVAHIQGVRQLFDEQIVV